MDPRGKRVVVLGAGGASRAICVELALAGASKLTIVNVPRDAHLAESLVKTLRDGTRVEVEYVAWADRYAVPAGTDILVNATSIGLYPNVNDKPNLDYDSIGPGVYVQDVIPNPAFTPFLQEAERRGLRWQSGLQMLVNQAALNITMWTGKQPNKDVMRKALEAALR